MTKKQAQIYQFKITLRDIQPAIWRRIQVPDSYTFWDLHVAIQDSMGWTDTHLHNFTVIDPKVMTKVQIGMPDPGYDDGTLPGWDQKISSYFYSSDHKADYVYDFGDNWLHEVRLEKVRGKSPDKQYPICVAGERACPPEDVGSVPGYEEFLKAISYPNHKYHREMLEWIGRPFDPEHFKPEEVIFDDPKQRLKDASQFGMF